MYDRAETFAQLVKISPSFYEAHLNAGHQNWFHILDKPVPVRIEPHIPLGFSVRPRNSMDFQEFHAGGGSCSCWIATYGHTCTELPTWRRRNTWDLVWQLWERDQPRALCAAVCTLGNFWSYVSLGFIPSRNGHDHGLVLSTMSELRAGRPGFDSQQEQGILLFATASLPALGLTQPPIQWVVGGSFPEGKATGAW